MFYLQSWLAKVAASHSRNHHLAEVAVLLQGGVAPGQHVHVVHRVHRGDGSPDPAAAAGQQGGLAGGRLPPGSLL